MKGDSDKAFHENVLFGTTCFVPLKEDFVKILLGGFLSGLYFEKYFCVQLSDLSIHFRGHCTDGNTEAQRRELTSLRRKSSLSLAGAISLIWVSGTED